jgi:hypothetical protein
MKRASMPETTIDKNRDLNRKKDNIGTRENTRNHDFVGRVSQTEPSECLAKPKFGFRPSLSSGLHPPTHCVR